MFVSFRGTIKTSPSDVFHDLKPGVRNEMGMRIFSGLVDYFNHIKPLLDIIMKLRYKKIYFSGFSLGGAMAILSSIYVKQKRSKLFVGLVTQSAITPGKGVKEKMKILDYVYHEGIYFDPAVKLFNTVRRGNRLTLNRTLPGWGHSILRREIENGNANARKRYLSKVMGSS